MFAPVHSPMEPIMLIFLVVSTQMSPVISWLAHVPGWDVHVSDDSHVMKRVHGGHVSSANQWPWVVAVRVRGSDGHLTCGGSVIARRWVLTAAHCFEREVQDWTPAVAHRRVSVSLGLRVGDVRLTGGPVYTADRVIFYPLRYHHSKGHLGPHDIALVRLRHPFKATDGVSAIGLPASRQGAAVGQRCYVAGWGRAHVFQGASAVLRHVELRVTSRRECSETLNVAIPSTQLCAMSGLGYATCKGDSGGPLACVSRDGGYWLTGLVSYGPPCGVYPDPAPTVFTDVTSYVPWMRRTMAKHYS